MLEECIEDLESKGFNYEVIVVNDCSKDKTT
jgi:glycosyltransferase involved in cell wall biosynthesis